MPDSAARLALVEQRAKSLGPDPLLAYLLWFFFGWASAHRFYLNRPVSAVLQILTYLAFLTGVIWWVADGFLLPGMIAKARADIRRKLLDDPTVDVFPGVVEAVGFNGRMRLDGGNLTIDRTPRSKFAGAVTFGTLGVQGVKTIPVRQITAAQLQEPTLFLRGYIRLSINGRDPRGGIIEAGRDENAVLFGKYDSEPFRVLRDALQAKIDAASAASTGTPAASQADEIEKLAALRDRGVLTDEEFAVKKKQILAS